MTDRIDLSADTYIDGEHLVTTSCEVAAAWITRPKAQRRVVRDAPVCVDSRMHGNWYDADQIFILGAGEHFEYRIPRATVREVYRYVEGDLGIVSECQRAWLLVGPGHGYDPARCIFLRRRAVLVCSGGLGLYALYEWIMEASHA